MDSRFILESIKLAKTINIKEYFFMYARNMEELYFYSSQNHA